MPSFIRKLVRGAKRQIKKKRRDGRSFAFYESGRILLAQYDCHDRRTSVARIANGAGVSVGAFYYQFHSKDAFIYAITANTFHSACNNANGLLTSERQGRASAEKTVRRFVRHIVVEMCERKNAGVIRAAFKLAPKTPEILEPIREYRTAVTLCARGLLGRHLRGRQSPRQIDAAVQIIFGTIIDGILEQPGPLKVGGDVMIDALSDMTLRYLEFSGNRVWSGTKEDKAESDSSPGAAIEETEESREKTTKGRAPIYDLDLRKNVGSIVVPEGRQRKRRKARTSGPQPKVATVNPKAFRPAPPSAESVALEASLVRRRAKRLIV